MPAAKRLRRSPVFSVLLMLSLWPLSGCERSEKSTDAGLAASPPSASGTSRLPLQLVVVGPSEWVGPIETAWRGISEQPLSITAVGPAEAGQAIRQGDVLLMPSRFLGEAVGGDWLRPLSEATANSPPLSLDEVLPTVQQEVRWSERLFAAPVGAPLPVLLVSADAADQVPRNTEFLSWSRYGEIVQELAASDAEVPRTVAAEPLADGDAALTLLTRSTEYAGNRWLFDRTTFDPLIDGEAYVRALTELCALKTFYPAERLTASQVAQQVAEGKLKLGIGWPAEEVDVADGRVELRAIPGGDQIMREDWEPIDTRSPRRIWLSGHGLVAAIGANSRQSTEARGLLTWLVTGEGQTVLRRLTDRATEVRRASSAEVASAEGVVGGGAYARYLQEQLGPRPALASLRIPGAEEYYAALDRAVIAAWTGPLSPREALARAADQWRELTKTRGLDGQREAWLAGQGLR
jgi:ABC-type glycerol-3-phosphate transport system substrate-binding protein